MGPTEMGYGPPYRWTDQGDQFGLALVLLREEGSAYLGFFHGFRGHLGPRDTIIFIERSSLAISFCACRSTTAVGLS